MENITGKTNEEFDIPGSVPIEIFHEILKYLSPHDLYNARNCCKKWRNRMESFWKIKCGIERYSETDDDLNSKFYRKFVERFSRWEGIYMYNSKLEDNWINQNYKEVVNDMDNINGFFIKYLCGDMIIGTFGNDQVWVMNAVTAKIEKRFYLTFPEGINIMNIHAVEKIKNSLIVVVGTITLNEYGCFKFPEVLHVKTWNLETEEPLLSLQMETIENKIEKVIIYKDLITVQTNHTVVIYNMKKEKFDYNRCCVGSLCCHDDKIAMGNAAGSIVIIDLDYTELMTLNCCESDRTIIEMQMKGNYLIAIAGSFQEPGLRACIWNIGTKTKLYQVEKVFQQDLGIYLHENKLCYVCGDLEFGKRRFRLCNLNTGDCILELVPGYIGTNNSLVIQCDIRNNRLLKLWSIRTGKLVADLQLSRPFTNNFFNNHYYHRKSKSRFAYLDYDATTEIHKWTLKIMDFQAKIQP